ncbi:MAG: glutamate synthase subunit beta, partial [Eubacteriales bacterium]
MGKPTGFLDYARKNNDNIDPMERIQNFNEFHHILDKAERQKQGARCMNCGVPYCQASIVLKGMTTGCPLHNLIPEWNDEIYNDNMGHAMSRLRKTNRFPEFTGRVCPALCEKACICGMEDGNPVTIRDNELFVIETAYATGEMAPRIPDVRTDKKIAVIGSGPAGLTVADKLNQRGHTVTVMERDDRIGGLLMYGIPNMKLEKHVIDRRVKLMEAEGVTFQTNANFGGNVNPADVLAEYDAVVLCCGAKLPRDLAVERAGVEGVHFAVDFLTSTTKSLLNSNLEDGNYISAKDKHVVIVGGGDTGNDCVGTSIRHGCASVTQIEMMPKAPDVRAESNPWPEWPKVCNTDYGQQEAIAVFGDDPRVYQTTIKELHTDNGKLTAVTTVKVAFKDGQLVQLEGTEEFLPADLLLIAAGFVGCECYTIEGLDLETSPRNTLVTEAGSYA